MPVHQRIFRLVTIAALGCAAALLPAGGAAADPLPEQSVGITATYTCRPAQINNPVMGSGLYSRPDPPGPFAWTWTEETRRWQKGLRVAEVQCVLQHLSKFYAGGDMSPGAADGDFGPNTERAVKAAQVRCFPGQSAMQNGVVRPDTWRCMRFTLWFNRPNPV
jgi:hypothetical protein